MNARDDREAGDGVLAQGDELDLRDPAPAAPEEGSGSLDLDNPFATGVAESPRGSVTPAPAGSQAAVETQTVAPPKVAPPPTRPAPPAEDDREPEAGLDLTAVRPPSDEDLETRHGRRRRRRPSQSNTGFLPTHPARLRIESILVRLIATAGVIGIGTGVGAILAANNVAGWITGLSVSALSVVLAAVLWRSRRL